MLVGFFVRIVGEEMCGSVVAAFVGMPVVAVKGAGEVCGDVVEGTATCIYRAV